MVAFSCGCVKVQLEETHTQTTEERNYGIATTATTFAKNSSSFDLVNH
jgi:hypothetical protein